MKCMIPEISWHNREPVLSIDIQPTENDYYKLATGGSDCHVLIWHANVLENGAVAVDMVADLTRHQRAVNAVRWSPNGQFLASADDDANIIIWNLKTDNIPLLEGDTSDTETWIVTKVLRGHKEDIYDICWSPSGLKLLSGSIDNTAIVWDFTKGKLETILSDHKAFVQGVAWDPKGQFLATLSSDRLCRVFDSTSKQVKARIGKGTLPVPESHILHNKEVKYFHDDTFKSYFRRLQFSPDGNLLITPCGTVETDDCKKALNTTFLFTLDCLTQPAAMLPLPKQCSVGVRCCPVLFELKPDGPEPVINLPYRMIIAVATDSDVMLYDTQQLAPFAYFQKIHYTRLTDLAWSIDGRLLMASSTDGFCTFITFGAGELGVVYSKEESEQEESILDVSGCEELCKEENVMESKPKKSNFLVKWANQSPKFKVTTESATDVKMAREKMDALNSHESEKKQIAEPTEIINLISPVKIQGGDRASKLSKITPKRIIPVKVGERETGTGRNRAKSMAVGRKAGTSDASNSRTNGGVNTNWLVSFFKKTPGVIATLDESEARDAWKCEEDEAQKPKDKTKIDEETDDATGTIPDFRLQIEESTTSHDINTSSGEKLTALETNRDTEQCGTNERVAATNSDMEVDVSYEKSGTENINKAKAADSKTLKRSTIEAFATDLNNMDVDAKVDKSESEKATQQKPGDAHLSSKKHGLKTTKELTEDTVSSRCGQQKSDTEVIEVCTQIEKENKKDNSEKVTGDVSVASVAKKTVRRIPLITLSSPKTKKQKPNT